MARFDVYRHPDSTRRRQVPFLVSIQSDALDGLHTTVVVPLVAASAFGPRIPFLHPVLDIGGRDCVLATNELQAVAKAVLGSAIGNASTDASAIVAALDYLISCY